MYRDGRAFCQVRQIHAETAAWARRTQTQKNCFPVSLSYSSTVVSIRRYAIEPSIQQELRFFFLLFLAHSQQLRVFAEQKIQNMLFHSRMLFRASPRLRQRKPSNVLRNFYLICCNLFEKKPAAHFFQATHFPLFYLFFTALTP